MWQHLPMPSVAPGSVPSPCVNVCRMVPATGLCEGCWRTIDEIAGWGAMDDAAKRVVWTALRERRARAASAVPGPRA